MTREQLEMITRDWACSDCRRSAILLTRDWDYDEEKPVSNAMLVGGRKEPVANMIDELFLFKDVSAVITEKVNGKKNMPLKDKVEQLYNGSEDLKKAVVRELLSIPDAANIVYQILSGIDDSAEKLGNVRYKVYDSFDKSYTRFFADRKKAEEYLDEQAKRIEQTKGHKPHKIGNNLYEYYMGLPDSMKAVKCYLMIVTIEI